MDDGDGVLVPGTYRALTAGTSWVDLGDTEWPNRALPAAPLLALIEAARHRDNFLDFDGRHSTEGWRAELNRRRHAVAVALADSAITALVKALTENTP